MQSSIIYKQRHIGLELYRIFSMFFIILFHFSDHGAVNINQIDIPFSLNWLILAFYRCWGGLGNCAFVLISGYFMIHKQPNMKRLIKLWAEVWFYSVCIGIICFLTKMEPFSLKTLLNICFPVIFNEYWYMSAYVILFLFSPFLNICLLSIDKKTYQRLLLCFTIIFSIVPTFTGVKWMIDSNFLGSFFMMYALGGYVQRFKIGINKNNKKYFTAAVFGTGFIFLSIVVFKLTGTIQGLNYFAWGMNKFSIVFTSTMWFMFFKTLNIHRYSAIICFISGSVFGVYLLHIGRLNHWIFNKLFNTSTTFYVSGPLMIIQTLAGCLCIFIAGILIDKIRVFYIEKPVFEKFEKINKHLVLKKVKHVPTDVSD